MDKRVVNQAVFGHDTFYPGQELLIDAVLAGRDCLGVMPTGGGKSLCYQLPALMLPGLTLVISPLISLMKDQVTALREMGVAAAFWNSAVPAQELDQLRRDVARGAYKLLYIAPERLDSADFVSLMGRCAVSLVAVDEAHCISQWGQDFRPSYLKIAAFLRALPTRPVVGAYTATATHAVRTDILDKLSLRDPQVMVAGFDRPNLFFDVLRPQSKLAAVKKLVLERPGRSGIVYCATRRAVESVCAMLNDAGVAATRYHAGLDSEERRQNQEDFQFDRKPVMVATNAFGMGIDKSNVSYVLHHGMPLSLEAYYQEVGRAGRDGEPADCILLFNPQDIVAAKFLIEHREEKEPLTEEQLAALIRQDYERLDRMVGYCQTASCYRGYILDYFAQPHGDACGNCGNCNADYDLRDITTQAQMILSCVHRIHDRLGYYVGPTLVIGVLRGAKTGRIRELGLDTLSTYGLLSHLSRGDVRDMVDCLAEQGYLLQESAHRTLRPAAPARDVLYHGKTVEMPVRRPTPAEKAPKPSRRRQTDAPETEDRPQLYDRLAALRLSLARQKKLPAYMIFSNATLRDMARRAPTTQEEFLRVNGVGAAKAERYASLFLAEIAAFLAGGSSD